MIAQMKKFISDDGILDGWQAMCLRVTGSLS